MTDPDEYAEIRHRLAELVGARLPGGCDRCDASHEFVRDTPERFNIWITHDPDCPVLADQPSP